MSQLDYDHKSLNKVAPTDICLGAWSDALKERAGQGQPARHETKEKKKQTGACARSKVLVAL